DAAPPSAQDLAGVVRRSVALVEQELDGAPNMLTMRELAPARDGDATQPLITVVEGDVSTGAGAVTRWRTVAAHFEDTVTFFPTLGLWEVWQFINLTGDTHPMHIHLNPFHILARRAITLDLPDG